MLVGHGAAVDTADRLTCKYIDLVYDRVVLRGVACSAFSIHTISLNVMAQQVRGVHNRRVVQAASQQHNKGVSLTCLYRVSPHQPLHCL